MPRRLALLLCAFAAALGAPPAAYADVSDIAVKAAFLPRFARYVTWPSNAAARNGPMAICVIGDDPFGRMLNDAVASQQVDGRGFVVKRLSSAAGASDCAIAFVDGSRAGEILAALGREPVLTVTDARDGSARGIIHFAIVGGRVRFFIDNAQAQARGLTISSRLLALAIGVKQK
ncbi:MAG: YfiR family protein [Bacillota bacterium]